MYFNKIIGSKLVSDLKVSIVLLENLILSWAICQGVLTDNISFTSFLIMPSCLVQFTEPLSFTLGLFLDYINFISLGLFLARTLIEYGSNMYHMESTWHSGRNVVCSTHEDSLFSIIMLYWRAQTSVSQTTGASGIAISKCTSF